MVPCLGHRGNSRSDGGSPEPGQVIQEVGEAAGALQVLLDEGVAVGVGFEQPVPPREVEATVVATVKVVDVVCFGGSTPGG